MDPSRPFWKRFLSAADNYRAVIALHLLFDATCVGLGIMLIAGQSRMGEVSSSMRGTMARDHTTAPETLDSLGGVLAAFDRYLKATGDLGRCVTGVAAMLIALTALFWFLGRPGRKPRAPRELGPVRS